MERIEGIRIVDVRGMGAIAGGDAGSGSGNANTSGGNLAGAVVDHALRYRAQRPLVDALLREVGLGELGNLDGLLEKGDQSSTLPTTGKDGKTGG